MMALRRPARHGVARSVAVAALALAVATILGGGAVTAAGADAHTPAARAATLLEDDVVHGNATVGVRPPRAPDIGRAGGVRTVPSVTLAVAAAAAGLACVGACHGSRRPADGRLPAHSRAWSGPGGRRAPPLGRVA
jgi:hypothetical protein